MAGMKIAWYGTATLMLACGETRILIDPYLRQYQRDGAPLPLRELSAADAVFITHPHLDHFADIGAFLEAGIGRVYVSENGIRHAAAQGIRAEAMHPLAAGDVFRVGEMTVRAHRSSHCRFDLWTVLSVLFSPRTYLRAKDAVALLRQTKKWKIKTEYPTGADLLVFPYQGRAGMHRYMRRFLRRFRPEAVMADHFDDAFPPLTHEMKMRKFVPAVKAFDPAMRAWVPEIGEWYEV